MKRLPFLFLPLKKAIKLSKKFRMSARRLAKMMPAIGMNLRQAGIELEPEVYLSLILFAVFQNFLFMSFLLFFVFWILKFELLKAIIYSFCLGIGFSFFTFFYLINFPRFRMRRKQRALEMDLLYALRALLIKMKSGISLYDSMVGVAKGDYGAISKEFERTIKEIGAGIPQIEALERLAMRSPSTYFRRIIWQITNSMRVGADITSTMERIVEGIAAEQRIEIRDFGAKLNPLALVYMVFSVIVPTLGITFLFVLGSFSGIPIPTEFFYLVVLFLVVFQVMFMGLIKSKRPVVGI
jgi:flagellar protein FlaJ